MLVYTLSLLHIDQHTINTFIIKKIDKDFVMRYDVDDIMRLAFIFFPPHPFPSMIIVH